MFGPRQPRAVSFRWQPMTARPDCPRLRHGLAAAPSAQEQTKYLLWDNCRITHRIALLHQHELAWAQLFDGRKTIDEVQRHAQQNHVGVMPLIDELTELAERLDAALLLDSARLFDYLDGPIREPACLGCYHSDPERLRDQLAALFTGPDGPGLPAGAPPEREGSLRAVLVPHMDYTRGGAVYGHGFRELFDKSAARVFVIIATSHYSRSRFTLSRQNFLTPLGEVETDRNYVHRIASVYGDEAYSDPFAHFPEHSIELEVVLLQYLYERHRPFRIVPLLVGSFGDAVRDAKSPEGHDDISRMIAALKEAEAEAGEEVCYIISGDLAHIGPKFGDAAPVHAAQLEHSKAQDQLLLKNAEAVDCAGYFRAIAAESDARRICGLPPTLTALAAANPSRGRLLKYDQFVHPEGFESVSFASMAFDR
jgi:AmmeMemoRadiSam system protein B